MFKVGQKVVCKHSFIGVTKNGTIYSWYKHPIKGNVYVIDRISHNGNLYIHGFNHGNYHYSKFEPLSDLTIDEVIKQVSTIEETV